MQGSKMTSGEHRTHHGEEYKIAGILSEVLV